MMTMAEPPVALCRLVWCGVTDGVSEVLPVDCSQENPLQRSTGAWGPPATTGVIFTKRICGLSTWSLTAATHHFLWRTSQH